MSHGVFADVLRDYPDYLRDESRKSGQAESIAFPQDEKELIAQLGYAEARGLTVTVQGARTGITAGAVPSGGHVINLSRMNRITATGGSAESRSIIVQPGVLLDEARKYVAENLPGWFLTPDPTETSASLGGMVACNASGARSYAYGATRKYVRRIRVVLVDGSVLDITRGQFKADGRKFSLTAENGRILTGELPGYKMPDVKNASGLSAADGMDLIDLFIGSEGTLGVFSEIEIGLVPLPAHIAGLMVFTGAEKPALEFVKAARAAGGAVAIEFFDCNALNMLRGQKERNPAFKEIPGMPAHFHTAVYLEYCGATAAEIESRVEQVCELMTAVGADPDHAWLSQDERELERMKKFRHSVPEAVNLLIDQRRKTEPKLTKLGTDLAVPDSCLDRVLAMYHGGLDRLGLEYVMFGHIGNNHLHVNIIPRTMADYEQGKGLYLEWARAVVDMGGTVSAEHGIGKLKTEMLKVMYGDAGVAGMIAVKKVFDPGLRLNRGNLFAP